MMKGNEKKKGGRGILSLLFSNFYTLLKLNVQFIIYSLGIITIPAAVSALYGQVLLLFDDELVLEDRSFAQSFRDTFRASLGTGVVFLGGGMFCLLSMALYGVVLSSYSPVFYLLAGAALCILLVLGAVSGDAFVLTTYTKLPMKERLKTAWQLMKEHAPAAFAASLIRLILFAVCVLLFPGSILFIAFILFSLEAFITCGLTHRDEIETIAEARKGE